MAAVTLTPAVNSSFLPVSIQYGNFSSAIVTDLSMSSLYIINFMLCLPINMYIVCFITVSKVSGVASELFSLNLSLYEIIVSFTSVPTILMFLRIVKLCSNCFLAYEIKLFSSLFNFGRPLFQCCVCVERYVAVIHPLTFIKYKALRYRLAFSAVSWIILLGTCLANMFFLVQSVNWMYYLMFSYYLILFFVQASCCVAVLRVLRQSGPGGGVRDAEMNHMKKKAFRLMMILLVTIVFNWGPLIFLYIIYTALSDTEKIKGSNAVFFSMMLTGFVHPLLYLHRSGKLPFIPHY